MQNRAPPVFRSIIVLSIGMTMIAAAPQRIVGTRPAPAVVNQVSPAAKADSPDHIIRLAATSSEILSLEFVRSAPHRISDPRSTRDAFNRDSYTFVHNRGSPGVVKGVTENDLTHNTGIYNALEDAKNPQCTRQYSHSCAGANYSIHTVRNSISRSTTALTRYHIRT